MVLNVFVSYWTAEDAEVRRVSDTITHPPRSSAFSAVGIFVIFLFILRPQRTRSSAEYLTQLLILRVPLRSLRLEFL
jgi:hypothetical protein